ncbi:MAG: low molecular weight phosphotyrosine protein phosphatase [Acidimicrobiales bacterium]|nr:low molecular weight phosphotyrosine protein phosphatase [Acidimicrobiales bacterium]
MRVCFVCLGNICRSPTAEAVARHLAERGGAAHLVHLDSAGTGGWHAGEGPDRRAVAEGRRRGIAVTGTARRFEQADFAGFDLVVAMDRANRRELLALAPSREAAAKVHLLRSFDAGSPADADVPDPYDGGPEGFAAAFDLIEAACRGLLAAHLGPASGPGA